MSASRTSCLLIVSGAAEGVSAQSFLQTYTLASPTFTIQLASPNGRQVEYIHQDDSNRRWFNEFRSKSTSTPIAIDAIDPNRYSALLIPDCPGAVRDLYNNSDLSQLVTHFVKEKKPVCAIGNGVAALCSAVGDKGKKWELEGYSLTAPSVMEIAREPDVFTTLPIILEDFVKDHGAKYSSSIPDAVHVVIDRHIITGQNSQSTVTAVQNLILMCSQKLTKSSGHKFA